MWKLIITISDHINIDVGNRQLPIRLDKVSSGENSVNLSNQPRRKLKLNLLKG